MTRKFSIAFPIPTRNSWLVRRMHIVPILCALGASLLNAQDNTRPPEQIGVIARPSVDSIVLRWAPVTYNVWCMGNTTGYRIERYVISRRGSLLPRPEKTILEPTIAPWDQGRWGALVKSNRYAAIAAQALFGEQFEVDIETADIWRIVNKVKENEQRFSFALFCADMSPQVARASGLWVVDKSTRRDEKYLYRIVVNGSDETCGSVFVSPTDAYHLSEPQYLRIDRQHSVVALQWDRIPSTPYTAFVIERGTDGKTFARVSESPLVTLSRNNERQARHEYATDSIPDASQTWFYRVRGITPFGETGPPSEVVSSKPVPSIEVPPYIRSATSTDNASILIEWELPEENNAAIKGFQVERSPDPQQAYRALNGRLIAPYVRMFRDTLPGQVNYYRVHAIGLDGRLHVSHPFFAQLVDSIPPQVPSGLKAVVDTTGTVTLSWTPVPDNDVYGYRVYRSWFHSEEPAQQTEGPVTSNEFQDNVDLHTLNEKLYYQVMAVDINQNHSPLSEKLEVTLPDKVRPQPPVMIPVTGNKEGVLLMWTRSPSTDVVAYRIFRKTAAEPGWRELHTLGNTADSVFTYRDTNCPVGSLTHYTVLSIDDAGLESLPANPVTMPCVNSSLPAPVKWRKPQLKRDENKITLSWEYDRNEVDSFSIFRAVNNGPPVLLIAIDAPVTECSDAVIPGNKYGYRVMARLQNGNNSAMSEELIFEY